MLLWLLPLDSSKMKAVVSNSIVVWSLSGAQRISNQMHLLGFCGKISLDISLIAPNVYGDHRHVRSSAITSPIDNESLITAFQSVCGPLGEAMSGSLLHDISEEALNEIRSESAAGWSVQGQH